MAVVAVSAVALAIGVVMLRRPGVNVPVYIEFRDPGGSGTFDEPTDVSIIHLIATPERYDGKAVRLSGWFVYEFESTAIYLARDDAEHMNTRNGLCVDIDEQKFAGAGLDPAVFHNKWVMIEGLFDESSKGHGDLWSGGIHDVHSILERRKLQRDRNGNFVMTDEEIEAFTDRPRRGR